LDDRKPTGNSSSTILLFLLLVLGVIIAWNGYSFARSEEVAPEMAEASLKASIYLVTLAVDAEFEETGVYPPDLETIDVEEEEVTYSPNETGYILVATDGELTYEYRSGDDLDPYRTAFEYLLPGNRLR
jgi:hypothetical protein